MTPTSVILSEAKDPMPVVKRHERRKAFSLYFVNRHHYDKGCPILARSLR